MDGYEYAEKPATRVGAPLVFTFHGTGGDETQFVPLAEQIWPSAHIVSPRGDVSEHGALRFFRRRAEGVYDFDDLKTRVGAMAGFLRAHKTRPGAPSRVIGLGYSNGANILAAVAFEHPDIFDDLALMHPLVPWTPAEEPRLASARILISAGRRDPICPPALTTALRDFLERQGANVELEWHDGGHEIRPGELQAVARMFGG